MQLEAANQYPVGNDGFDGGKEGAENSEKEA